MSKPVNCILNGLRKQPAHIIRLYEGLRFYSRTECCGSVLYACLVLSLIPTTRPPIRSAQAPGCRPFATAKLRSCRLSRLGAKCSRSGRAAPGRGPSAQNATRARVARTGHPDSLGTTLGHMRQQKRHSMTVLTDHPGSTPARSPRDPGPGSGGSPRATTEAAVADGSRARLDTELVCVSTSRRVRSPSFAANLRSRRAH